MPNGWQALGNVLAGGIDRQGAWNEGQLYSAKTVDAIARAKLLRNQQAASERLVTADRTTPEGLQANMGDIVAAQAGQDLANAQSARLRQQEYGFRSTAADPTTPWNTSQRALYAVQGKPISPVEAIGAGGYVNIFDERPAISTTPLGDSMIAENQQNAALLEAKRTDPDRFGSSEPLMPVETPEGTLYVPRSKAAYMAPPSADTKPTVDSATAAGFFDRMKANEDIFDTLGKENYAPDMVDFAAAMPTLTGGTITSTLANQAMSDKGKRYYQAAADWVRAKLRKESGAVIGKDEMLAEIRTYFPLPNDPAEVREQKRQARLTAQSSMERAGAASLARKPRTAPAPIAPPTATPPAATQQGAPLASLPRKNAKGWNLEFDPVNQASAYVNPADRTQFEEVR
jgi:hypothetical protein